MRRVLLGGCLAVGVGGVVAAEGVALAVPAAASAPASASAAREVVPVESFARMPMLAGLVLSPDGSMVAGLAYLKDSTVVVTRSLADGRVRGVLTTDDRTFRFRWVAWASPGRLLVSVGFPGRRGFVPTMETRLLSVKTDGSGLVNLVSPQRQLGEVGTGGRTQQFHDRVVDLLPDDDRHVLLALPEPERVLPAVYRVDVETATRRIVKAPERDVHEWLTDAQHRVRVGVRSDGKKTDVLVGEPDGSNWRTAWSWTDFAEAVWPMGFGLDPQELYVRAAHEGRFAVFTVRLDDPALPRTLRLADARRDVEGGLLRSPSTDEVIGVRHADGDGGDGDGNARLSLWDTRWRAQALAIDEALPGRVNRLLGFSRDEQRYLVHSSGNGVPGRYYLGDRADGSLVEFGPQYPELQSVVVPPVRHASMTARDGLKLDTFLTLPAGRTADDGGPPLPMVLLPHGGPQGRDDVGFDPLTAFLANRGYAVLQVNFRGSSGSGVVFSKASRHRWGLEMQDDLTDAVAWAVERGVADRRRVCIVGGSYGGYAALMGVVKTPDLYRCAISLNGVSDLPDLIAHQHDFVHGREWSEAELGRLWGDRERLKQTSPARQAERIQAPVLLVHGTADRTVPVDQSQSMASALQRAGKSHRYLPIEGGDHGLTRNADRLVFFKAMEAFLAEHLQAAPAAAPASR